MAATNVQRFSGDVLLSGEMNLQQVSNVASIKLNSNVVTEFPRSKKLIKYPRVAMTANSSGGYVASASSYYNTDVQPYEAFDVVNDGNLGWESGPISQNGNGRYSSGSTFNTTYLNDNPTLGEGGFQTTVGSVTYTGEWVQIQLPVAIQSTTHVFGNSDVNSDWNLRIPQSGVILGSTNGSSWETIHSFDDTIKNAIINVTHTKYYSYFRLVVLSVGTNQTLANVPEWEIFGLPEYDPDAAGVDVKVTSYPNVPNTDWLEVYYDAKDLTSISGTIADLSGKSVTGSLNGDVSIDTLNDVKSFSFDGSGDYIRGQLTSFGGEQTFTFSLWFNMLEFVSGSNNSIFQIGSQGASEEGLGFRVQSGSVFRMYTWGGPSSFNTGTVHPNTWYHAVGTYAGGVMTLYVDGNILQSTSGSSLNLPTNPYFALGVQLTSTGAEYSTSGFKGSIANFRLFNRALTSDEIYQLYAYQKEYFGHGDLGMTLKAGRLGIGTSEPGAALDVRGDVNFHSLLASASGGTETQITDQGISYKVHSFTSTGTSQITVDKAGFFECLVVAGGGAGGRSNAAGGGGGGVVIQKVFVHTGTYDVVVGAGNTSGVREPFGGNNRTYIEYPSGNRGGNSSVFGLLAIGGGNGGGDDHCGVDGGSGGGCADDPDVIPGRSVQNQEGTNGYGNRGGYTRFNASAGSGGGGAGEPGYDCDPDRFLADANTSWTALGRDGGNGVGSTIRTGSIQYYGGGGGGAQRTAAPTDQPGAGVGGKGGGGNGASANNTGSAGSANTGGGGGGTSHNSGNGGNGGSGIVVVRYKI
jgi:hypothetical protein